MNTLLLLVFYPAIALLVYTMLVIRGMYLKQARHHRDESLGFIGWVMSTVSMRSRRRYLIYLLLLLMAITGILIILMLYPFHS